MSVIHFKKEDTLGYDPNAKLKPEGELNQTIFPAECDGECLKGKTVEEQNKLVKIEIQRSIATIAPDIQKPKTVNPLDLPYFMVATIVMSFGFMFVIVAVTWYKILLEKEERL